MISGHNPEQGYNNSVPGNLPLNKLQFPRRTASRELQLFLILGLLLASCSAPTPSPTAASPTKLPSGTSTPQSTVLAASPSPLPPTPSPTAGGPQTLVVWLPPIFDPSGSSTASIRLRARLGAFQATYPDLNIQIRIKAVSGPGGLLDSLTATAPAAPANLPALILLPRPDLETAALKGLIYPLGNLSAMMKDPDWFAYARQLATIQGDPYGLPFAGDAMLLMYRAALVPAAPSDWPSLFKLNLPLAFPAADPQGMLALQLYLSAGGSIQDDQGRPTLQVEPLTKSLTVFADGLKQGTFSGGLSQYQTDGQAAQAYHEQPPRAQWLVSWSSRFLSELPADTLAAAVPSLGTKPYTLATGWVWALAEPNPELRPAAVKLAEYLVQSDFMAQWTVAAGYLPTRPSALASWSNQTLTSILSPILMAAQARPSNDLLLSLGAVLEDATVQMLKPGADPALVAQAAAESLAAPPAK
jgi:multiple sugar transport system substrate-binding protein